jgi:hypothetical protein
LYSFFLNLIDQKEKIMKTIFTLVCASVFYFSHAQIVFCPAGAEWHYLFSSFYSTAQYNETIKYTGDTVVGSETWKVLTHIKFFTSGNGAVYGPTHLKQIGDTIFMKNSRTKGIWQILYNFNTTLGQNWQTSLDGPLGTTINYTVDVKAVSVVTVNGIPLKELGVTYKSSETGNAPYAGCKITERLGCSQFLFNYFSKVSPDAEYFSMNLCYQDNSIGLIKYSATDCNFSNPVGIRDQEIDNVQVYPNPSSSLIHIKYNSSATEKLLTVTNSLGQIIYNASLNNKPDLNVSSWSRGIYFLKISDADKHYFTKFLKE